MPKAHVLNLEQMRIMASPVRQRIIAALFARGESSVAEIADMLERKPDTLYHHLRLMLEAGIIVKSGERIAGKNREALYTPVAQGLAADPKSGDPEYLREFARVVSSSLADAAAHHSRAFREPAHRRLTFFETANVRLAPKQAAAFNAEMKDLFDRIKNATGEEGERQLYVFVSTPVLRK